MRLTIENTKHLTMIDGAPCRVWEGKTENGIAVTCFINRVRVRATADQRAFELELQETPPVVADPAGLAPSMGTLATVIAPKGALTPEAVAQFEKLWAKASTGWTIARAWDATRGPLREVPATERDLLLEALGHANRVSGLLNDIARELFRVLGNLSDAPEYDDLHALLRQRFHEASAVGLFIAAGNLRINLPADLIADEEDDAEACGETPEGQQQ